MKLNGEILSLVIIFRPPFAKKKELKIKNRFFVSWRPGEGPDG